MIIYVLAAPQILLIQLFLIMIAVWYLYVSKAKAWIITLFFMFTLGTYFSHNFSVDEVPSLGHPPVGYIYLTKEVAPEWPATLKEKLNE